MLIRTMIADDDPYCRRYMRDCLSRYEDINVIHEARNGLEVLDWFAAHTRTGIDVLLLDLGMPMPGIEVMAEIKRCYYPVKVIVVTCHEAAEVIKEVVKGGASGFVGKEADPADLYAAIVAVANNDTYFSDHAARALAECMHHSSMWMQSGTQDIFSLRDRDVIRQICAGEKSKDIADKLHLSVRTVEDIRHKIYEKTGVKNVAGLFAYAHKHGLIV